MAYYEHIVWDIELLVDIKNIIYTSLDGNKIIKDGKHLFTLDMENHTIDFGDDFEKVSCSFSYGRSVYPFFIKKFRIIV